MMALDSEAQNRSGRNCGLSAAKAGIMRNVIFLAAVAALFLLAACAEVAEEVTSTPTPATATTTATPTEPPGGSGGGEEGTPAAITPFPTPPPVPADWATFNDTDGRFTLRYPLSWYDLTDWLGMPSVASWDQRTWRGRDYPDGGIRLDITIFPLEDNVAERPPDAVDAVLGGEAGWQFAYTFDPTLGPARNHVIVADHGGLRFMITAWFADEKPDETVASQIIGTLRFTSAATDAQ